MSYKKKQKNDIRSQVLNTSMSFASLALLREQKRQCSETTTAGARYLIHNDMVH